jgi:hypothetical protein
MNEKSAALRQHAGAHDERRNDLGGVREGCLADENIVKKRHQQENARVRMTGTKCSDFEWRHAILTIDDAKERITSIHHEWQGNPKDDGIDTKVVQRFPSCSGPADTAAMVAANDAPSHGKDIATGKAVCHTLAGNACSEFYSGG